MSDQTTSGQTASGQQDRPNKGKGMQYWGSDPPVGSYKPPRTSLVEWLASWFAMIGLTIVAVVTGVVLVLTLTHSFVSKATKYGQVDLPATKTLSLPAGRVDLILESDLDEGSGFKVPESLTVSVTPATAGLTAPTVSHSLGGVYSGTPNHTNRVNGGTNSYRRVWKVQVAQAGVYRITTGPASFDNPNEWTVDAGIAPKVGQYQVWEAVLIPYAALMVLWLGLHVFVRLRERREFNAKNP